MTQQLSMIFTKVWTTSYIHILNYYHSLNSWRIITNFLLMRSKVHHKKSCEFSKTYYSHFVTNKFQQKVYSTITIMEKNILFCYFSWNKLKIAKFDERFLYTIHRNSLVHQQSITNLCLVSVHQVLLLFQLREQQPLLHWEQRQRPQQSLWLLQSLWWTR